MKLRIEDLDKIAEKMKAETKLRENAGRVRINVHLGTCGIASGAREVLSKFLELASAPEGDDVIVTSSGCAGFCSREPMCTVELPEQPPVKYADLDEEKAERIFRDHAVNGNVVTEFALGIGNERVL